MVTCRLSTPSSFTEANKQKREERNNTAQQSTMWFVLFNTEHFELMRRHSVAQHSIPHLTQTSLMSVLHSKSYMSCSHTVQTLVTELQQSKSNNNDTNHDRKENNNEESYFTVLHYLPIFSRRNEESNDLQTREESSSNEEIDNNENENVNEEEEELCMLMVLATQEKQLKQSSTCVNSLYARHLATSVMNVIHGFMNLIIGELTFEQVHSESHTLKRRLNLIGNVIDGLLDIESSLNRNSVASSNMIMNHTNGISMHMKLQIVLGLPVRHMCFCTKNATQLKQKALNKLKFCAENYWNVADLAIYANSGICVATDNWTTQSYKELTILGLYLHLSPPATARDIPIHTSKGFRRFISVKLDDGVELCILAGKTPSIQSVIQNINNETADWNFISQIQNLICSKIQETIQLDSNVLCFLFIDRGAKIEDPDDTTFVEQPYFVYEDLLPMRAYEQRAKMERALIEFYISISNEVFESHRHIQPSFDYSRMHTTDDIDRSSIKVNQSFMRTKSFGLCAIRRGAQELYCIYNDLVPAYAYVGLANETMDKILRHLQSL